MCAHGRRGGGAAGEESLRIELGRAARDAEESIMSSSMLDSTPGNAASRGPRRSELPWMYSPCSVAGYGVFIVGLATAVAAVGWHVKRVSPWPLPIVMFILGAGVGLTGIRAMLRLHEASWPLQRLQREFTGGRFLTLRSAAFSPAKCL